MVVPSANTHWSTHVVALLGAVAVVASCLLILLVNDQWEVRASADSAQSQPIWQLWIPPSLGALAVFLVTRNRARPVWQLDPLQRRRVDVEAGLLALCALAFAATLVAFGSRDPLYVVAKVVLLVVLPGLTLIVGRRACGPLPIPGPANSSLLAVVPVAVWAAAAYATPLAPDPVDLGMDAVGVVLVLGGGFVVNAVVEEVFYRRWLVTRLQAIAGATAAILWSAIAWSAWHAAIQGVGSLGVDLAAVIARHLPMGVFLGLLWIRRRRMWPILTVHGLLNSVPVLLGLVPS